MRPTLQFSRYNAQNAVQHCLAVMMLLLASAGASVAEPVPNHLLNFTQSLIGQVDEQEFAKLPPAAREAVRTALAKAPLRSWSSSQSELPVDLAAIARPLGLNLAKDNVINSLLVAGSDEDRKRIITSLGDLTGQAVSDEARRHALSAFAEARSAATQPPAHHVSIFIGRDGNTLDIEWDPQTNLITATPDGDTVTLIGKTRPMPSDSGLTYAITKNDEPVSHVTRVEQESVQTQIYGVWVDNDGSSWVIRTPNENADSG